MKKKVLLFLGMILCFVLVLCTKAEEIKAKDDPEEKVRDLIIENCFDYQKFSFAGIKCDEKYKPAKNKNILLVPLLWRGVCLAVLTVFVVVLIKWIVKAKKRDKTP